MHKIIFFPEKKIIKKNVCAYPNLKFSDPLSKTHFFLFCLRIGGLVKTIKIMFLKLEMEWYQNEVVPKWNGTKMEWYRISSISWYLEEDGQTQ